MSIAAMYVFYVDAKDTTVRKHPAIAANRIRKKYNNT